MMATEQKFAFQTRAAVRIRHPKGANHVFCFQWRKGESRNKQKHNGKSTLGGEGAVARKGYGAIAID